jgi:membrane protein
VVWRVKDDVGRDRVLLIAGGATFYLLLALVPGLTALVTAYGLFIDPETVERHLAALTGLLPSEAMEVVTPQLRRLASERPAGLGLASGGSLLLALWSANAGVKALFEAMNVAYDQTESRGFVRLNMVSLAFTLTTIVALALVLSLAVVLPVVLGARGAGPAGRWIAVSAGLVLLLLFAGAALSALYRFGPSRPSPRWRWITPGSVLAILAWIVSSVLFSWYAANLTSFAASYGTLGSVIGLMLWMWISVTVGMLGAELNAELERQAGDGPPDAT